MTEKEKIAKLKGANEVWEYILEGCELGDLYLQDLEKDAKYNFEQNLKKIVRLSPLT